MEVRQVEAKDTLELRNQILRPGLPVETCYFEGDNDEFTFHLGAYIDGTLASIASFYLKNHNDIKEEFQFQLRGMATSDDYRGQGLSSALLRTAFPMVKRNHVNIIWCNARKSAVGFYEKVGFEKVSPEFEIEGVGPHFLMTKSVED